LLRREGIATILYAGVVTTACVLLRVAAGFDLGYRQYLVADCTGTLSARDQEDAERLIGNYLAEIVTAADAVAAMEKQSHAL
ncbi:MAG: isochorismatase family protein, partial [Sphingopyxis sp.]